MVLPSLLLFFNCLLFIWVHSCQIERSDDKKSCFGGIRCPTPVLWLILANNYYPNSYITTWTSWWWHSATFMSWCYLNQITLTLWTKLILWDIHLIAGHIVHTCTCLWETICCVPLLHFERLQNNKQMCAWTCITISINAVSPMYNVYTCLHALYVLLYTCLYSCFVLEQLLVQVKAAGAKQAYMEGNILLWSMSRGCEVKCICM